MRRVTLTPLKLLLKHRKSQMLHTLMFSSTKLKTMERSHHFLDLTPRTNYFCIQRLCQEVEWLWETTMEYFQQPSKRFQRKLLLNYWKESLLMLRKLPHPHMFIIHLRTVVSLKMIYLTRRRQSRKLRRVAILLSAWRVQSLTMSSLNLSTRLWCRPESQSILLLERATRGRWPQVKSYTASNWRIGQALLDSCLKTLMVTTLSTAISTSRDGSVV